ncbi:hypothetical protein JB92DRAFT_3013979 [Gautieria morchelliformis]|nr:hypothetical protein JB92DRAFT_3013979 [Gautieria morchelliformis]
MLPLIAFSVASVVPCAGYSSSPHLLYGATSFACPFQCPSEPRRHPVQVEFGQEHARVATYSTSSTGTGAIAASAMYEIRESPALPYLKPQCR